MAKFSMNDDARKVHSTIKSVGCQDLDLPRGRVHICEAPGCLTSTVHADGGEKPATGIGLIIYDPDPQPGTGVGRGLMAQMDADSAREIAASLLKMAQVLDPAGMI